MIGTQLVDSNCPYCGEPIQLVIDCSIAEQEYVEDCQVCCQPMLIQAVLDDDGFANVSVLTENE
ncbi:MAG: CPXCG motif-containing cysteine-rich protein [Gammaproteobacteria bacterium]|nr:CPXCG motif-containing cysteine-rich protein [Gammaproteobacteria bacterium]